MDYLLKVSVFQRYKDKELERNKFSVFTGTMGEKIDPNSFTSSQINREDSDLY